MAAEDALAPIELLQPLEAIRTVDLLNNPADLGSAASSDEAKTPTATPADLGSAASSDEAKTPTATPADDRGCYLTFEAVSEGALFLNWSETVVADALAFFRPIKAVPKFKFRQNGGKSELIRGLRGGTGTGMKRYFEGWMQFLKLGREYESEFTVLQSKDVALHLLDAANGLSRLQAGQALQLDSVEAVAAVAPDNATYDGVATMTRDYFVGTGNREGAALLFKV